MKVTVCQIDPSKSQLDQYLSRLQDHLKAEQSDFLLLPEMCLYDWLAADPTPDAGRWVRAVTAHETHIASFDQLGVRALISTRPIVTPQGSHRNEAYIWTEESGAPAGLHQKYYLPDEEGYWEHTWYDRGPKQFDIGRVLGMRVGVQVCTEMWFFEWARHYGKARADLICVPRATPVASNNKWLAGGQAAAVCSGAYHLSSNLCCAPGSNEAKVAFGGQSWVIDPDGNVLATTDTDAPFATVEIDLEYAQRAKSAYPRYVRD